jgi:tetratricopeptide (TPR) repeat protein
MIYTKQKMYELAFENLRLGYIYLNNSKESLQSLGDFYLATDQATKAIEMYKNMTNYHPYYYLSFYYLGKAYAIHHEPLPAINAFRQAITLRPYAQENYKELGQLFQDIKNYPAAAQTYKDALDHGLNKRYFYKQLSIVHKKARAQKSLEK